MSKLKVMYNGHPFSPATNLTSSIGPTDTIIAVNDVSVFPPAPNVATINDGDGTGETIIYTAKTSNALSGCKRGIQGKAKSHSMGADIARYFTAYDYDTLRENINSLNSDKVEKEVGKVLSDNNYTAAEKQEVATIKNKVDTTTFESFKASNTKALNKKADAQAVNDALAGKASNTALAEKADRTDLDNKADKQKTFLVTLPLSGWGSTAPYRQTVSVAGMKASYLAKYSLVDNGNVAEYEAFNARSDIDTKEGSIEAIYYEAKPTVDLHIRLVVDF